MFWFCHQKQFGDSIYWNNQSWLESIALQASCKCFIPISWLNSKHFFIGFCFKIFTLNIIRSCYICTYSCHDHQQFLLNLVIQPFWMTIVCENTRALRSDRHYAEVLLSFCDNLLLKVLRCEKMSKTLRLYQYEDVN